MSEDCFDGNPDTMTPSPKESNPNAEPAGPLKPRPKKTLWGDPMNTSRWTDWSTETLEITRAQSEESREESVSDEAEEQ